ncbi:peptidase domain-containing ABC transporter [Pseudomonas sp. GCM10022188]|uniref:peptidase domain-containing ABC transporter n=1 Tax=Pseudomonas TaxID=286 RepID=UPI001E6049E5|nr:peptidase domain-containing ABC transporter [Pseudomonas oryzagri]MCC6075855.1 peptidase domain-containing ABC transporter [Pseudomonas oryzagri]
MAEKKSLQDCLVFIHPAKRFDEQLIDELSAAVKARIGDFPLSTDGLAVAISDVDLDGLASAVADERKVVAQLANGNWVVPVAFKYELGEISTVELHDPLASEQMISVPHEAFMRQWSGTLLQLQEPQEVAPQPAQVVRGAPGVADIARIFRDYQRFLSPILFAGFLVSLLSLASPFFLMLVLDKVVSYQAWSTLTTLVIGAAFLLGFESTFEYIRAQFLGRMTKSVGTDASALMFRHTASLPAEIYESRPLGAWIGDNRQSERMVRMLRQIAMSSTDYLFALLFFAVLLWINWILTCVAVATCVLQIAFAFYWRGQEERKASESRAGLERRETFLVETLTHLRTIKILGLLGRREDEYAQKVAEAEQSRQERDDAEAFVRSVTTFIERLGNIVMLAVGAAMVMQSSLSVGALVACNILMRRLTGPLARLPVLLHDLKELQNIHGRWQEILRGAPPLSAARRERKKLLGAVEFKKIYFRHGRDSRFQLMVDATFPRGETLAVVGRSGAGKTTVLNLMLGLNQPQVGLVCLDGSDLRELDIEHVRKQIGVVSHDVGLFRGTVSDNIAAWDRSISLERIQAAARMALAHDFIQALPKGYETLIGDDGANLSSGQKSRLALARALVRDPALLLLDEVTGDLDPLTEQGLIANIIECRRGRTTIFFTHHEFVASRMDAVFFLDDGRLVAAGQHERLLRENAAYRNLWGRG